MSRHVRKRRRRYRWRRLTDAERALLAIRAQKTAAYFARQEERWEP